MEAGSSADRCLAPRPGLPFRSHRAGELSDPLLGHRAGKPTVEMTSRKKCSFEEEFVWYLFPPLSLRDLYLRDGTGSVLLPAFSDYSTDQNTYIFIGEWQWRSVMMAIHCNFKKPQSRLLFMKTNMAGSYLVMRAGYHIFTYKY